MVKIVFKCGHEEDIDYDKEGTCCKICCEKEYVVKSMRINYYWGTNRDEQFNIEIEFPEEIRPNTIIKFERAVAELLTAYIDSDTEEYNSIDYIKYLESKGTKITSLETDVSEYF